MSPVLRNVSQQQQDERCMATKGWAGDGPCLDVDIALASNCNTTLNIHQKNAIIGILRRPVFQGASKSSFAEKYKNTTKYLVVIVQLIVQ